MEMQIKRELRQRQKNNQVEVQMRSPQVVPMKRQRGAQKTEKVRPQESTRRRAQRTQVKLQMLPAHPVTNSPQHQTRML